MESPAQRVARLIKALESLLEPQVRLLAARDFPNFQSIQERAQPLVVEIATLVRQPGVREQLAPSLRRRGEALVHRQAEILAELATTKTAFRHELSMLSSLQARLYRYRNAYGARVNSTWRALAEA